MKNKFLTLILALLALNIAARAAVVDTLETNSMAMKKSIKTVIIKPDRYAELKEMPVVYLLHGYSGDYKDWTSKAADVKNLADLYNILIVCPDGGYGSWYWDSPLSKEFQYETWVAKELVSIIDAKYKTIKDRKGRAITGLSMGGHGALYLAMKHQDVFGAAGSMSGGVDIRPFPKNWDMAKRIGSYAENKDKWEQNTVVNMLHLLTPNTLKLIIDCGTEDFFYQVNENLHEALLYRNIAHDYITRPGGHNWPYWNNAVKYQMLFMNNFFVSNK